MSDGEDNNVVDLNTQILRSIRDEIVRTRTELRDELVQTRTELRDEIAQTRAELRDEIADVRTEIGTTRIDLGASISTLEAETIRGFTAVRHELDLINRRLDNVAEVTGGSHRDHEARITRLETAIAGMRRRRPRT